MVNLRDLIKEALEEHLDKSLILKENTEISESLQYHIDNDLTLTNNIFRVYSKSYFDLVNEVRNLWKEGKIELNEEDTLMVESDLGQRVKIRGEIVYLDAPYIVEEEEDIIEEAEHRGKKVNLNKPFRTPGGPKKFAVYVKSPGGGVKKVTFGDPNLRVRNRNKVAAKSFDKSPCIRRCNSEASSGYLFLYVWNCLFHSCSSA